MTAENMNRARQFLTEQQPALLNQMMSDLDQGRNVTLAGRGTDLFDEGGDTDSQMDQFMRESDGEQPPTPPQQPQQRPQQARQSGAPQGTPPTPDMNPRQGQQQAQTPQPQVSSGGGQSGIGGTGSAQVGDGGDASGIPGAGDTLTDEIIMAMAGTRAASAPTRAPRGAQVNTQMPRPGSANQGPETSASQPRIENVQEAQQIDDNLPMQQGGQQQQSAASRSLPGAGQRAQMQSAESVPRLQQPSGRASTETPVNDIVREQQVGRQAAQMTEQFNQGQLDVGEIASRLNYQSMTRMDAPDGMGPEATAVYMNNEGDQFMIGTRSGQVYMNGRPLDGVQFAPERIGDVLDATLPQGLSDASPRARGSRAARAVGGAL
jgi:hypothetical protein